MHQKIVGTDGQRKHEFVQHNLGGQFRDIYSTILSTFLCIGIFHNKMLDKMLSHSKHKAAYLNTFLSY